MPYGASAKVVKNALNDLPTLYPEGVTVTDSTTADGGKLYNITFSADRGKSIKEIEIKKCDF